MLAEQEKVYLDLRGTHGTSFSRSLQIKKTGFIPNYGRHGGGIYLWASSDEMIKSKPRHDIMLGACFAHDRKKDHIYKVDNDDSIAVIIINLKAEQSNYLDFKELNVSHKFLSFLDKYKEKLKKVKNDKKLLLVEFSKVCDLFIKFIERLENRNIKIIQVETETPISYKEIYNLDQVYCHWVNLNKADCYVVRDRSLINIEMVVRIGENVYEYYESQTKS